MTGLILVLEDDPVMRLVARKQLSQLGYSCITASSGEEALERICGDIVLIFMDIGLPGIDGITTARLIRENERIEARKRVPIVALTAHSIRDECLGAGMDDFLQKPALLADIERVLDTWLTKGTERSPTDR